MSKMKKIVATMLCAMMIFMSMSTLCLATEAAEENQPNIEPKLNSRIVFEGETYWNIGCTRKRNEYSEEKSAVVWAVHKNKGVVLTTYGYVKNENIIKLDGKVISYDKETKTYKHNGDLLQLESKNEGILKFEEGVLTAGITSGNTKMELFTLDGEKIANIDATVTNAEVVLNFPEGKFDAKIEDSTVILYDKEENEVAKFIAKGEAQLDVNMAEDGSLEIIASGNANGNLSIKGEEILAVEVAGAGGIVAGVTEEGLAVEGAGVANATATVKGEEVLKADIVGEATIEASKDKVKAEATVESSCSLLQKLTAKLNGKVIAEADKEGGSITASGDATVNDKEIIKGDATLEGNYMDDPYVSGSVTVLEQPTKTMQKTQIPIVSTLTRLLNSLRR